MVPGVVLGSYFNRAEERMNYSIRIAASQTGRGEVPGSRQIYLSAAPVFVLQPIIPSISTNHSKLSYWNSVKSFTIQISS